MAALPTFATVAGSLKAAANTVKSMVELRDAVLFHAKANELQAQIADALADSVSAYEAQTTQLQRIRELEEKLATFESWDSEKKRYDLKELGHGALAYMLKPEARGTEPPHWICTNCYGSRRISIIQYLMRKGEGYRHSCPACHMALNPSPDALAGNNAKWLD